MLAILFFLFYFLIPYVKKAISFSIIQATCPYFNVPQRVRHWDIKSMLCPYNPRRRRMSANVDFFPLLSNMMWYFWYDHTSNPGTWTHLNYFNNKVSN